MKLGVLTILFQDKPIEEALDIIVDAGVDTIELATGGYLSTVHCNPHQLLEQQSELAKLQEVVKSRGLTVSALSCHGNPLHPGKELSQDHTETLTASIKLAGKLEIPCVNCLSGLPGAYPQDQLAHWICLPFPDDPALSEALQWQWKERLIPFWKDAASLAKANSVQIGIEMLPGCLVYNPETMLALREAVGPEICSNFDPSHLFWQDIDICTAIRNLGETICHFHAKDSGLAMNNIRVNGLYDTRQLTDEKNRAWIYRTVGYGHDAKLWKDVFSTLRQVGYDFVASIEHEDSLMSASEGFAKAVAFLKEVMITEASTEAYWA